MVSFFRLSVVLLTLSLSYFALCRADSPRPSPILSLSDVAPSGDQYPSRLPVLTRSAPFAGKEVLFVFSHGVEDHEIYYQLQYFTARGANVTFACPHVLNQYNISSVVLSDFYRPSYVAQCQDVNSIDNLHWYDAVFVAGGLPSSSDVRLEARFERQLLTYWREAGPARLLAIICSGSESMIESGLLAELELITGSPASRFSLEAALYALHMPLGNYKGMSDQYPVIPYPSEAASSRAQLVLGRNPDASPLFCATIGNTWMQLDESAPAQGEGDPLHMVNGVFRSAQLTPLSTLSQLPLASPPMRNRSPSKLSPDSLLHRRVGILVASGAHDVEVMYLYDHLRRGGANVTFLCPSWIPAYKQGEVYLFSEPPTVPRRMAVCDHGVDEANAQDYDVLLTAGGLLSSNGVLRNEAGVPTLLMKVAKAGGLLGFVGTGNAVLLPTLELAKFLASNQLLVPSHPYNVRDLVDAGIVSHPPTEAQTASYPAGSHGQPFGLLFGTGYYDDSMTMFLEGLIDMLSTTTSNPSNRD
mmetsp:Transcript_18907/g.48074  ORF Transcript_18907/g.48074 Transcript_18907/m.48074 type:complete len:528 (-) Transcript_18907:1032-2615(-)|eukprot:CAMPEP_0177679948 /NCGR_PEP_ID=MMETSP0447-20121125/29899_1 /TAXON_ID=0 /ORGANISM="Stygamoeba regulata, Strain BSH-02190019" /LENGTH=527 /DNA_ID=CAMNT_0019189221 /DNA_START=160 /DNA_END=1743 /DNA_ORIENTATION=-